MKRFMTNQQGVGHLGLILAIVVVLCLGGVGYFVLIKNKQGGIDTTDEALQTALKNAKCEYEDKDLCKFFTSYKIQKHLTMTSTNETDGQKLSMILKKEGDGKTHLKVSGNLNYELITIGKTTYTKGGDTWWKKTNDESRPSASSSEAVTDFKEPTDNSGPVYKKVGKEACGNLQCFKYQQIDPSTPSVTFYIWFDDSDYQLRHTLSEGNGSTNEATYSYEKVSIKEPAPVKELGPNQHIVPGQSEPVILPAPQEIDR